MDNLGYFGIEFETLYLNLKKGVIESKDFKSFETKITVELKKSAANQEKICKWRSFNNENTETENIESSNINSTLTDFDDYLSTSSSIDSFSPKSTYIDLNDDTVNQLCNSDIVIQVSSNLKSFTLSSSVPTTIKATKGKSTVDVPAETNAPGDILFEITIPLSQLLGSKSSCIEFNEKNTLDTFITPTNNAILCKIMNEAVMIPSKSFLKLKLYVDNDFAEFVYGGCVYQYKSIKLSELSSDMTVRLADAGASKGAKPAVGKGKVSDPSDVKAKAIESISKIVAEQAKFVSFQVTLDMQEQVGKAASTQPTGDEIEVEVAANASKRNSKPVSLTTVSYCPRGVLGFNNVAAIEAAPETDLFNTKELWSVEWNPSQFHFLHRSKLRRMLALSKDPNVMSLAVSFKKVSTAEGIPVFGTESALQVSLDLPFSNPEPGMTEHPIAVYFGKTSGTTTAAAATEAVESSPKDSDYFNLFEAMLTFVQPIIPSLSVVALPSGDSNSTASFPEETNITHRNVDVMGEFRKDIKNIVAVIAKEFVKMKTQETDQQKAEANNITLNNNMNLNDHQLAQDFPDSVLSAVAGGGVVTSNSYDNLKSEFMSFLSTSGILHSFKEKLRPRIMQIIYVRCGPKGLAAATINSINNCTVGNVADIEYNVMGDNTVQVDSSPFNNAPSLAEVGKLMNDVFVYLIQESNTVLNTLFASTLVAHQATSLDKTPYINDVVETNEQAFVRLGFQAYNAECDLRFQAADQYHLERLCLAKTLMETIPTGLFDAYVAYSNLYLRQIMKIISLSASSTKMSQNGVNNNKAIELKNLMLKCHQVLSLTHSENPSDKRTLLLLACSHARLGRQFEVEKTLLSVINTAVDTGNELQSLVDLLQISGNVDSSDSSDLEINLKTVDPLCYCLLAGFLSLKQEFKNPLLVRKAILMATYAYETYQTANVSSILFNDYSAYNVYGNDNIPRRTAVLCLVKSSIFLFDHGFAALGSEVYNLALSCEIASNQKAQFRNAPSVTPPFIRALLKHADFYSVWMSPSYVDVDIDVSLRSKLFDIAIDW